MKKIRLLNNVQGYTLVEALMTTLIMAVILGAILMILLSGSESWQVNSAQVEANQEVRKAMEWMKQELIQGGSSTITNVPADGTWYPTITFKTASGVSGGVITWSSNTIQYLRGGTNSQQLLRRSGGVDKVIAIDMQALQFRRQSSSANVVEINVQAQKDTPRGTHLTASANFQVKLRN